MAVSGAGKLKRSKKNKKTGWGKNDGTSLLPGISLNRRNEAIVAPELADVLFDFALLMEERSGLAVDVQHVLAALVMGARSGEIAADTVVDADNSSLQAVVLKYVRIVFAQFEGKVGEDE